MYLALAPVARLTNTTASILHVLARNITEVEHLLVDEYGMYNMFAPNWMQQLAVAEFCEAQSEICAAFLEAFSDLDVSVDNLDRIKSYLTHMPSGAGYRNFVHYAQLINA